MEQLTDSFTPVLDNRLGQNEYTNVDLSVNNDALNKKDLSRPHGVQSYLNIVYKQTNAKSAFGGYLEKRAIYQRSDYFNNSNLERNIHLGIDIWSKAGTSVISPLEGTIHSFKNNLNFGDYGPTILLHHQTKGLSFYTLYGHLSNASLNDIQIGNQIRKGQRIGRLGNESENGDYAPHLHFQIIIDLENYIGDYPGVCDSGKLNFYRKNCPDPNLLLKFNLL